MKIGQVIALILLFVFSLSGYCATCPEEVKPIDEVRLVLPSHWERRGVEEFSKNWVSISMVIGKDGKTREHSVAGASSALFHRAGIKAAEKLTFSNVSVPCSLVYKFSYAWVMEEHAENL